MKIGIHDADKTKFPNLALMKLSAAYKQAGHEVEFFAPGKQYDKVVSSKVFTFTEKDPELPATTILGGVGYDVAKTPYTGAIKATGSLPGGAYEAALGASFQGRRAASARMQTSRNFLHTTQSSLWTTTSSHVATA